MDEYGVQVNIKIGETLINIRGANAGEALTNLDTLASHATHLGEQISVIQQTGNATAGGVQAQAAPSYQQGPPPQAPQYAPPAQAQYGPPAQQQYGPPPTQATGQHNPVVSQGAAPPAPGSPTCAHGAMAWKKGVSRQGKPYEGYYCQVPRGQGASCQPVYVN